MRFVHDVLCPLLCAGAGAGAGVSRLPLESRLNRCTTLIQPPTGMAHPSRCPRDRRPIPSPLQRTRSSLASDLIRIRSYLIPQCRSPSHPDRNPTRPHPASGTCPAPVSALAVTGPRPRPPFSPPGRLPSLHRTRSVPTPRCTSTSTCTDQPNTDRLPCASARLRACRNLATAYRAWRALPRPVTLCRGQPRSSTP
jgi:hypothetical protein